MRVLTLGGIAGPALFSLIAVVSAILHPGYSHSVSPISELGASGVPHGAIMNYLGFVPAGLMLAAFGVSLARVLPRHALGMVGSAFMVLFGVGLAAAGTISCDAGCPQSGGSLENTIHNGIGPISVISLICGVGILGYYFRRLPDLRPFATYSFVTSVVALFFLIVLMASLETRALTGLWQRLLLTTMFLWCAVIGLRAFRYAKK